MGAKIPFYQDRLRSELNRRSKQNPKYSLRAFARALGISAGALSQIMVGKRIPSATAAKKICKALKFSTGAEANFLRSVSEFRAKKIIQGLDLSPSQFQPENAPVQLDPKKFEEISSWYHMAILELTYVKDFISTPEWIAKKLGITVSEGRLAIEKLVSLGFLSRRNGILLKRLKIPSRKGRDWCHKTIQKILRSKI